MAAGFHNGGTVLAISPSVLVVLHIPSESSSLHAVHCLGATKYIFVVLCLCSYRWLHYPTVVR